MVNQKGFSKIMAVIVGLMLATGGIYIFETLKINSEIANSQNTSESKEQLENTMPSTTQNETAVDDQESNQYTANNAEAETTSSFIYEASEKLTSLIIKEQSKDELNIRNIRTIPVRVIMTDMNETDEVIEQSDADQVAVAISGELSDFIKKSSYDKTKLEVNKEGVYQIGDGICNLSSYGDKVSAILERSLKVAAENKPFNNFDTYIVVHPKPNCGETFSHSGKGFRNYPVGVNNETVLLRGLQILNTTDPFIYAHEFGHHLGNLGHTAYHKCDIVSNNNSVLIDLEGGCDTTLDWPPYDLMSPYASNASDYTTLHKQVFGWLAKENFVMTDSGTYTITSRETNDEGIKAVRIPIPDTDYIVFFELGNIDKSSEKKAVIPYMIDTSYGNLSVSFLGTDASSSFEPLNQEKTYILGNSGISVHINNLSEQSVQIEVINK